MGGKHLVEKCFMLTSAESGNAWIQGKEKTLGQGQDHANISKLYRQRWLDKACFVIIIIIKLKYTLSYNCWVHSEMPYSPFKKEK